MRIVFMGTPAVAAVSLQALLDAGHDIAAVYTQPDRPAGSGLKLRQSAVKELALRNGLPVYQPSRVRTEEAAAEFESIGADVVVVVAYGRILPDRFLNAFRFGAINLHFSLLPKYRGAAPVNWAIASGETKTGVTSMKMDSGLDTGDILLQRELEIGEAETAIELMERSGVVGAELLVETLERVEDIDPTPQDEARASYAPILKKSDGLIDWAMPSTQIADRVRGFQPFPLSFTTFRGKRLIIWSAKPFDSASNSTLRPGEIAFENGAITVQAGVGTRLNITELQLEGKKRMSSKDFINGLRPAAGEFFGSE
jgi:methionyl-tRNA formyltransferase